MSVHLDPPHTLGFRRPLTQLVKRTLSVKNSNAHPVAFKVKTTAPKLYCVRPNSGRIEPGETVEVQVMLQAMKEEPPLSAKCKDKFLIQSTYITPAKETMQLHDIWNSTDDSSEESKVHQQKIKVAYLASEGTIDEEDELQGQTSGMLSTSESKYDTVRPFTSTDGNGHAAVPEFSVEQERSNTPEEVHHDAPEPERAPSPVPRALTPPPPVPIRAPSPPPAMPEPEPVVHALPVPPVFSVNVHTPTPAPAPAPIPAPAPVLVGVPKEEHEALAQRFEEAQAELQRMRALLQAMPDPSLARSDERSEAGITGITGGESTVGPSELRRRTRALSSSSSTVQSYTGTTTVGGSSTYGADDYKIEVPEGVPLQVVIIIALGVFATTYLFF